MALNFQNFENDMSYEMSVFQSVYRDTIFVGFDLEASVQNLRLGFYREEVTRQRKRAIDACIEELQKYARVCFPPPRRLYSTDPAICRRYLEDVRSLLQESFSARGPVMCQVEYSPLEKKLYLSQLLLYYMLQYIDSSVTFAHTICGDVLHAAAYYQHVDKMREYLRLGHDPNTRNLTNGTLLHAAVLSGNTSLVAELLSLNKLNPNVQDGKGFTPLMMAVIMGKEVMTLKLLEHGANPNVGNSLGNTPLHAAATLGNKSIIKVLLSHSARTDISNAIAISPLFIDGLRDEKLLHSSASRSVQ